SPRSATVGPRGPVAHRSGWGAELSSEEPTDVCDVVRREPRLDPDERLGELEPTDDPGTGGQSSQRHLRACEADHPDGRRAVLRCEDRGDRGGHRRDVLRLAGTRVAVLLEVAVDDCDVA